jgi:hypothetical protein
MGIGLTDGPQLLLKGVLVLQTDGLLLARRQAGVWSVTGPSDRVLIGGFDLLGPAQKGLVVRKLLFELMHIA